MARNAGEIPIIIAGCPGSSGLTLSLLLGATAVAGTTKKKHIPKLMAQITDFKIKVADYRNRDAIIVRRSDFNQETLETEAKNALYYLFAYAHGELPMPVYGNRC